MSPDRPPQRGEVWRVAFDPEIGGEIRKTRPAVVVSNDLANRELNPRPGGVVDQQYWAPLSVGSLCQAEQRKAMAHQLSTISKLHLRERVGRLTR